MTGMVIAAFPAAGPAIPHCVAKAAELISRKSRRSIGLVMLPPSAPFRASSLERAVANECGESPKSQVSTYRFKHGSRGRRRPFVHIYAAVEVLAISISHHLTS